MTTIKKIRFLIIFYIVALVAAGVTAFPVESELNLLCTLLSINPETLSELQGSFIEPVLSWLYGVKEGMTETNDKYPYLAYGFDWLAYAHLMIAALFVGPYIDPIKNKWVIYWGIFACISIFPLACICGPIRSIPFYWTLVDCSFGLFGILPLIWCVRLIKQLEKETVQNQL